jgi:hypothetical protein
MNHLFSTLEEKARALTATATPKLQSAASALQAGAKQAGVLLAEKAQTALSAVEQAAAAAAASGAAAAAGGGAHHQQQHHELTAVAATGSAAAPAAPAAPAPAPAAAAAATDEDQTNPLFARRPPPPALEAADEGGRAHRVRMLLVSPGAVDLAALRRAARLPGGVPARDGLRALTWKLLLGYLPAGSSADDWPAELARRRAEYRRFCDDLIVDPASGGGGGSGGAEGAEQEGAGRLEQQEQQQQQQQQAPGPPPSPPPPAPVDHPLATQPTSKWAEFFRDGEVLAQIRRDVARTHPESTFLGEDGGASAARRRGEVTRGLFVWAKLNTAVRYVQGMNELFAVLYWVFSTDPSVAAKEDQEAAAAKAAVAPNGNAAAAAPPPPPPPPPPSDAEADAFWCFVALVSGPARDLFCASLDNDSAVGVRAVCARLARALRARDPSLAAHLLDDLAVDPRFFAFRWVTLMLSREFPLEAVVEVWDAALAAGGGGGGGDSGGDANGGAKKEEEEEARLCFFLRMSLAMLSALRARLLAADFATCIKLLQQFPADVPVRPLIAAALAAPSVPP